jgi:toxin FitB
MNLVDSCAWLEYFADDPNADAYAGVIADIPHLVVPTIVLQEVFRRILSQAGENEAMEKFVHMKQGIVAPLDESIAVEAARIGNARKLPLADSVILATARLYDATLWTQDAHFADIDGVWYFAKKQHHRLEAHSPGIEPETEYGDRHQEATAATAPHESQRRRRREAAAAAG